MTKKIKAEGTPKHFERLGLLYGHNVYINLPESKHWARPKDREVQLELARNYFEQSFKEREILDSLREYFNIKRN